MTRSGLLDRLALVACALLLVLILGWIAFHPLVAVFLQLTMVLIALASRFGGIHLDAGVYS